MSLFPFWYDEFEAHNPVITQNNIQINNINTQPPTQSQNISDEDVALPDGDHMKVVENEINKSNKIYSNEVTPTREEQDSLRPEIEMVSNKDKLPDDPKSHNSEKILIKSSNDTRLVNHSEDHNMNNNNVVTKYILVDENENKTENEFVFSENVNIDTLSYNEPLLESMKKKNEKEQEENHINLKKLD